MKLPITHKISLLSVMLILVTAGVVALVFYSKGNDILVDHALENLSHQLSRDSFRLVDNIARLRDNVRFLAATKPVADFTRLPLNVVATGERKGLNSALTDQHWRSRLAEIFSVLMHTNPNFLQARLIAANGEELVRVDRNVKGVSVIVETELQNKSGRDYIDETLGLLIDQVYLSNIDLNRELGIIQEPYVPVLRIATPVFDAQQQVRGLIVINLDIRPILTQLRQDHSGQGRSLYVTDQRGNYLVHPNASRLFGVDLGKPFRAAVDFTGLTGFYQPGNKEQTITLLPEETRSQEVVVFSKIPFGEENEGQYIAIGLVQPYADLVAAQQATLASSLKWSLLLMLAGIALAVSFSSLLVKPLRQVTEGIQGFMRDNSSGVLPVMRDDEIGILARAFTALMEKVSRSQAELNEVNLGLEDEVNKRTKELTRFKTTLDQTLDSVFMFDPVSLKFIYANAGAMAQVGYSEDELMNMSPVEIKPNFNEDQFRSIIQPMISGEKAAINFETLHQHKNGSFIPVEIFLQYINPTGESPRFVAIVRDISERARIDKIKNEFISTVSHELRTPLTSIRGSLGLINGGAVGELPEQAKAMLKIASNNTERLLLLINDILDIEKIESGKMAFRFESLLVVPLLEQAVNDLLSFADQHDVNFVVNASFTDARVFADRDRLTQVLFNLMSNAAKFSPAGSNVELTLVRHHDDQLRISVTDFGPGIPEDFQDKVFKRFTQSDSSDTRDKGGTGLGLAISLAIMEKHGGHINFVSREGIGTTFYLELPELVGDHDHGILVPRILPGKQNACVLIVEDDSDVATLIQMMLSGAGYSADIAYNTQQAREMLAQRGAAYKLMTLDILLPDEGGVSLLRSLRADSSTCDLPVVVVSAKADDARHEINGGAVGILDWLSKPIDEKRLLAVVKNAANKNKLTRILHVEDEQDVHQVVSLMLQGECELVWTTTLAASRDILEAEEFDLVLLDIGLPDGNGLDLLDTIERRLKPPRVVIFSAQDVSHEYASRVSDVLVKAKSSNQELLEIMLREMRA